jgi:hypothetical protein
LCEIIHFEGIDNEVRSGNSGEQEGKGKQTQAQTYIKLSH